MITTYEGQHCHHSVGFPRGGLVPHEAAFARHMAPSNVQLYDPRLQYPLENSVPITQSPTHIQGKGGESHKGQEGSSQTSVGEGLLGDIVPPGMRNRSYKVHLGLISQYLVLLARLSFVSSFLLGQFLMKYVLTKFYVVSISYKLVF